MIRLAIRLVAALSVLDLAIGVARGSPVVLGCGVLALAGAGVTWLQLRVQR
jgi:hypothetical protein